MTSQSRQKRQRTFYLRVTANFILFCVIAVPLQFHVSWYADLTSATPNGFAKILMSGPMYFYALILCLEGNLRLEHYPKLLYDDRRIYFLRILLLGPPIVAFFQYYITPYYKSVDQLIPMPEQVVQIMTGLTALTLSTIVHHQVVTHELRRIR